MKFGLEEWIEKMAASEREYNNNNNEPDASGVIMDADDDEQEEREATEKKNQRENKIAQLYMGLKVGDMVKVTAKNKFFDEDAIVRRLKGGRIYLRFYTYGSMFEEWLNPEDVRKLSEQEVVMGLSGPNKPITQQDLEEADDNTNNNKSNERFSDTVRKSFTTALKGDRNRRQDRVARTYGGQRDIFGRSDEQRAREESNWNWYKDQQQPFPTSTYKPNDRNINSKSSIANDGAHRTRPGDDRALRDVDSQWGRKTTTNDRRMPERPRNAADNRRAAAAIQGGDDWSAFVAPVQQQSSEGSNKKYNKAEEDDFFASLMSDLSKDLKKQSPSPSSQSMVTSAEDDFFASLMSDINTDSIQGGSKVSSSSTSFGGKPPSPSPAKVMDDPDDFFMTLEAELESVLNEKNTVPSPAPTKRIPDKSVTPPPKSVTTTTTDPDDFFASFEAELDSLWSTGSSLSRSSSSSSVPESSTASMNNERTFSDSAEVLPAVEGKAKKGRKKAKGTVTDDTSSGSADTSASVSSSTTSSSSSSSGNGANEARTPNANADNLQKYTIPVLKEMLKERGLKVSGKKSELIERLQSASS
jgi:hypothetical protein